MEYSIRTITIMDYDAIYALWTETEQSRRALNPVDDSREGIGRYLARNPGTCFASARIVISRLIDLLATGPAHSFPMERREGIFACELPAYARSGFDSPSNYYKAKRKYGEE